MKHSNKVQNDLENSKSFQKVALFVTRIRKDEKAIIKALESAGIEVVPIFDKEIFFSLENNPKDTQQFDLLLERSINHARALYTLEICEKYNIPTINNTKTAQNCGNKFLLIQELNKSSIQTPKAALTFTKESAIQTIKDDFTFPIVLKPAIGSWGRLLAKANDWDAAHAILGHKKMLGSYHHSVFYLEEFIKKTAEYKILVMNKKAICAVKREASCWASHRDPEEKITKIPLTNLPKELIEIAQNAAIAIKGDIVAVDILEKSKSEEENNSSNYYVIDIDYTVEFHAYFKEDIEKIMQELVTLVKSKLGSIKIKVNSNE